MNWLSIVQLLVSWLPTVKGILDRSSSNSDAVTQIKEAAGPISSILLDIGEYLFPDVKKELQIAAAAVATFDPDLTKWVQGGLNAQAAAIGLTTPLEVDGIYGPKTREAVKLFQAANDLVTDGWAGRLTQAALDVILGKN